MQLERYPHLIDQLAASYSLGSLQGRARTRFEAYARQHANIRLAVQRWSERFSALTELSPAVSPPDTLWPRIAAQLAAQLAASAQTAPVLAAQPATHAVVDLLRRQVQRWRRWAVASSTLVLAGAGTTVWQFQVAQTATQQEFARKVQVAQLTRDLAQQAKISAAAIRYVSILADQTSAPAMLVLVDAQQGTVQVQRLGNFVEGAAQSLQLWGLPTAGSAPKSLGVLTHAVNATQAKDATVTLPADLLRLQAIGKLAISLEPLGGVPEATGPTGPVLFSGALVQRQTL